MPNLNPTTRNAAPALCLTLPPDPSIGRAVAVLMARQMGKSLDQALRQHPEFLRVSAECARLKAALMETTLLLHAEQEKNRRLTRAMHRAYAG